MTPLSSEAERLAAFVMRMQTRLGSCRESCNEYDKMAWDDYDQAAALLRRIPELEAERDQLRAELEKVPAQLGYTSMMGDEIFAGIFEDAIRPINNAVVIEFESNDELRSFLRWHHASTKPATQEGDK